MKLHTMSNHPQVQGLQAVGLMPNPRPHSKSTKRKLELKCEYCPSTFISNNNLRRHIYELHKDVISNMPAPPDIPLDKILHCRRCDIKFESKNEWIEHKISDARVMKPYGPFQWGCDLCGAYVSRKEKLINHIHNHLKDNIIIPAKQLEQQQKQQILSTQQNVSAIATLPISPATTIIANNNNSVDMLRQVKLEKLQNVVKIKEEPMEQHNDNDNNNDLEDESADEEFGDEDATSLGKNAANVRQSYHDEESAGEQEQEFDYEESSAEQEEESADEDSSDGGNVTNNNDNANDGQMEELEEEEDDDDDDDDDDGDGEDNDDNESDNTTNQSSAKVIQQQRQINMNHQKLVAYNADTDEEVEEEVVEQDNGDDEEDVEEEVVEEMDDDDDDDDDVEDEDDTVSSMGEVHKNNNNDHNGKSRFSCDLCQVYFETQTELQQHVKMHFLNGPGSVTLNTSKSKRSSDVMLSS